jgi:hypothetical protein
MHTPEEARERGTTDGRKVRKKGDRGGRGKVLVAAQPVYTLRRTTTTVKPRRNTAAKPNHCTA